MIRRKTRKVFYGNVAVGGDAPVSVQSMCTFPVTSGKELMKQIISLAEAGCEIVRVSVRDSGDVAFLGSVCRESPIPVIADIHFDHKLAVMSANAGVAGLRINPGNIGSEKKVRTVIEAAGKAGVTVRVGINSGSLEKDLQELYSKEPARALCESGLRYIDMMEKFGFGDLVFSLKSSDAMVTVEANRLFARGNDYPLHIGVTEAGPKLTGTVKSVVALTLLLADGIGDTVRVSLSGDPVNEIMVARAMLSSLGLNDDFPEIISCPTCGRCHLDVAAIAEELERVMPRSGSHLRVAVMGCEVNGPGEAREADIGIAGTSKGAVLFKDGKIVRILKGDYLENLLDGIDEMTSDKMGEEK